MEGSLARQPASEQGPAGPTSAESAAGSGAVEAAADGDRADGGAGDASAPVRARGGGEREGLEVDLGRGERKGEEGANSGSGGRATANPAAMGADLATSAAEVVPSLVEQLRGGGRVGRLWSSSGEERAPMEHVGGEGRSGCRGSGGGRCGCWKKGGGRRGGAEEGGGRRREVRLREKGGERRCGAEEEGGGRCGRVEEEGGGSAEEEGGAVRRRKEEGVRRREVRVREKGGGRCGDILIHMRILRCSAISRKNLLLVITHVRLNFQPNHQYVSPVTICNNNQQMEGSLNRSTIELKPDGMEVYL
ncbi:uncharacterized protein [Miscanthus floridulus]|uniref:uncharacterized protein n=1 Tax=Miscanthus floridulus TaxID=154761 RepID=UPI0034581015